MGKKLSRKLPVVLFLVLLSRVDSQAQTTASGGLTGVVSDASQAVVLDAVVELRDSAKGVMQTAGKLRADRVA
jgi:hypothetical protein